jgi:hypothetical protein
MKYEVYATYLDGRSDVFILTTKASAESLVALLKKEFATVTTNF